MEAIICGGKIGAWMSGGALVGVVIDATTSVPMLWIFICCGAIGGGIWKLAVLLTKIDDRLTALEKRNDRKDEAH